MNVAHKPHLLLGGDGVTELAGDLSPNSFGVAAISLANRVFNRELAPEVEVDATAPAASTQLTDAARAHVSRTPIAEQRER